MVRCLTNHLREREQCLWRQARCTWLVGGSQLIGRYASLRLTHSDPRLVQAAGWIETRLERVEDALGVEEVHPAIPRRIHILLCRLKVLVDQILPVANLEGQWLEARQGERRLVRGAVAGGTSGRAATVVRGAVAGGTSVTTCRVRRMLRPLNTSFTVSMKAVQL